MTKQGAKILLGLAVASVGVFAIVPLLLELSVKEGVKEGVARSQLQTTVCKESGECAAASTERKPIPPDYSECVRVIYLHVLPRRVGKEAFSEWQFAAQNACAVPTEKPVYVRLAFYDKDEFRHGFKSFTIEPMKVGEKVRLEGRVPRMGAVRVEVMEVHSDAARALRGILE